jgi:PAS domain S-box-containing protein
MDAGSGLMLSGNRKLIESVVSGIPDFGIGVKDDLRELIGTLDRNPDGVPFVIADSESLRKTDASAIESLNRLIGREGIPFILLETLSPSSSESLLFKLPPVALRIPVGPGETLPSDFPSLLDALVIHSIQYRSAFFNSLDGLCTHRMLFDENGEPCDCEYLKVNTAYGSVTGLLAEQVTGKTIRSFFPEGEVNPVVSLYWEVLKTGQSVARKLYFAPLNQWFEIIIVPVSHTVFTLIIRNITAACESDRTLKEANNNFKAIIDSGIAMIWTSGTDTKCDYFNEPWLNFTGRPLETELGEGWTDGVHPDDLDRCVHTYVSAFERRERFGMEYRLRHHTGEYRWIEDFGSPRYDMTGKFLGYVGHCIDVHSRKLTERALDEKMDELERFHRLAVDREYRIVELKKEVNSLLLEFGLDQKYSVQEDY